MVNKDKYLQQQQTKYTWTHRKKKSKNAQAEKQICKKTTMYLDILTNKDTNTIKYKHRQNYTGKLKHTIKATHTHRGTHIITQLISNTRHPHINT